MFGVRQDTKLMNVLYECWLHSNFGNFFSTCLWYVIEIKMSFEFMSAVLSKDQQRQMTRNKLIVDAKHLVMQVQVAT